MGEQVSARSYGGVAQLGEHLPCKQGVKSSNLSISICASESRRLWNGRFAVVNAHSMYLENCILK